MNKVRRKKIEALLDRLRDISGEVEELRDEEQDGFDNLPENIQNGERGEDMTNNIALLDDAVSEIQGVVETLSSDLIGGQ